MHDKLGSAIDAYLILTGWYQTPSGWTHPRISGWRDKTQAHQEQLVFDNLYDSIDDLPSNMDDWPFS